MKLTCLILFILFATLAFTACAKKTIKEAVFVPTKADISLPALKPKSSNTAQNVIQILEYSTQIECDILFATGRISKTSACQALKVESNK